MNTYRSTLEADYAQHLAALQAAGEIAEWHYELHTFDLAHGILKHKCTYTPDFTILYPDGRVEHHETKGFMREDAAVKIKLAAAQRPHERFIIVTRPSKKKGWQYKPVLLAWERKAKPAILQEIYRKIYHNISAHTANILAYLYNKI